jgi:hypothetical protein
VIHSYRSGGQNTLEYVIDIKITVMNATTPRDLEDILGVHILRA